MPRSSFPYQMALVVMAVLAMGPAFGQNISGDIDRDKDIDGKDLSLFINAYTNNFSTADLNKDSFIGSLDLARFSEFLGYVNPIVAKNS